MTLNEFIKQECDLVIGHVCASHSVSREEFLGGCKSAGPVKARRDAMFMLLDRGLSVAQIAYGVNRNRSTVYYWTGARGEKDRLRKMREYSAKRMEARA